MIVSIYGDFGDLERLLSRKNKPKQTQFVGLNAEWISACAGMTNNKYSVLIGVNPCPKECKLKKQTQLSRSADKQA
jgi:hypothetical protein